MSHGRDRPATPAPAALLVPLLAALCGLAPAAGVGAESPGASDAEREATVVVAEPAVRDVALVGFTRALARLPLVAEHEGRVIDVVADIGDRIGDDGTFAHVDDTFIVLELSEIAVQQERLRSQIAYDQREVERYRRLARENNAAASQLDTYEQTLRDNRHELRQLEVRQRVLEERQRRARIPAAPGWQVVERAIEPGQWVAAGERVGAIGDYRRLLVPFALGAEQLDVLEDMAGRPEGIVLDLPHLDRQLAAAIYRVSPGFDPETRKIAVDLVIDDPPPEARAGLRAELRLALPEQSGAVMVPAAALEQSRGEYRLRPVAGAPRAVLLLGRHAGPDGERVRVRGAGVAPGDRFLARPGGAAE